MMANEQAQPPAEDGLAEAVRIIERTIDAQERHRKFIYEGSERALTLSVATLAGGLSLLTLLGERSTQAYSVPLFAAVLVGAAANVVSLAILACASVATRPKFHVGPRIDEVCRHVLQHGATRRDVHVEYARDAPRYVRHNNERMSLSLKLRLKGLAVLVLAIASYSIGLVLLLLRAV